jgi:protein CASC3
LCAVQYIPKKGMFYEHDNRLATDEEEPEEDKTAKKRIWKADAAEKWGHDKFLELEQNPKSKDELVQSYGYDIR